MKFSENQFGIYTILSYYIKNCVKMILFILTPTEKKIDVISENVRDDGLISRIDTILIITLSSLYNKLSYVSRKFFFSKIGAQMPI